MKSTTAIYRIRGPLRWEVDSLVAAGRGIRMKRGIVHRHLPG